MRRKLRSDEKRGTVGNGGGSHAVKFFGSVNNASSSASVGAGDGDDVDMQCSAGFALVCTTRLKG